MLLADRGRLICQHHMNFILLPWTWLGSLLDRARGESEMKIHVVVQRVLIDIACGCWFIIGARSMDNVIVPMISG